MTARDWREDALCARLTLPPDLFFDTDQKPLALAVCAQCDVRTECLESALADGDLDGIRGGKTIGELARLDHARRAANPAFRRARSRTMTGDRGVGIPTGVGVHGTRSSYNRGCSCERCRAADTAYHRARNRGTTEAS